MTEAEANKLLAANDEETLIEKILTKYLAYCESRDFVLVSRPAIGGSAGRLQLSSGIAAAMQAPVCWVPPPRLFFLSTPSSRHGHGDNVASMAWGA